MDGDWLSFVFAFCALLFVTKGKKREGKGERKMQRNAGRMLRRGREGGTFTAFYVDGVRCMPSNAYCLCMVRFFALCVLFLCSNEDTFLFVEDRGRECYQLIKCCNLFFSFLLSMFVGQPVVLVLLCKSRQDMEGRL